MRTAAFAGDWDIHYSEMAANLGRYDVVLCDRSAESVLNVHGVEPRYIMPLYSHNPLLYRNRHSEKDIDVLFIGSINPARALRRCRLLDRIGQLSDRYRVVIGQGPSGVEYAGLMSRARTVFNLSARGELNCRVFETLAAGAMPLLEADNLEVCDYLVPHDECALYRDDEIDGVIEEVVNDGERQYRIQQRGPELAECLSGPARFDGLIDDILAAPAAARPFRELPESEQAFNTILHYRLKGVDGYRDLEERLLHDACNQFPNDGRFRALQGNRYMANMGIEALDYHAQAVRLCPESAVYALNAADATLIAAHAQNKPIADSLVLGQQRQYLEQALNASTIDGAHCLFPDHWQPLFCRWQHALACGTASITMLHAEVYMRLAQNALASGDLSSAERNLDRADALDHAAHTEAIRTALFQAMGDSRGLAEFLEKNIHWFPLRPDVHQFLAQFHEASGNTGKAREMAAKGRRLDAAMLGK